MPSYSVTGDKMIIHTVKSGETIYSISRQYGVDPRVLAFGNSVADPSLLAVGQTLVINLPSVTHTVRCGDTLYSISKRYGVTVNDLYRHNLLLRGHSDIYEGDVLTVKIKDEPTWGTQIGGYAYPFIAPELLSVSLPFMNWIMPFTYGFDRNASLVRLRDENMIKSALSYGTRPVMHLSTLDETGTFSTENASYLLSNRGLWETLAENVYNEIVEKGYMGLDVDFEYLGKENADHYALFIDFVRNRLNRDGIGVTVALAPKVSDDQKGQLYEGHDYEKLGKAANAVLCMTYEWGYTYGPPFPVSPVPSVRRVLEYAMSRIEPSKIFEGLSNYGYDFTLPYKQGVSKAQSISVKYAFSLAAETKSEILYDETYLAPYFYYSSAGKKHVVWFEDARSLKARLELIKEYGLKGGLYWNLNRENNQNLSLLSSLIKPVTPSLF